MPTNQVASKERKTFLRETLDDIQVLVMEIEGTQARSEKESTENKNSDEMIELSQADSIVNQESNADYLVSQSQEEFSIASTIKTTENKSPGEVCC